MHGLSFVLLLLAAIVANKRASSNTQQHTTSKSTRAGSGLFSARALRRTQTFSKPRTSFPCPRSDDRSCSPTASSSRALVKELQRQSKPSLSSRSGARLGLGLGLGLASKCVCVCVCEHCLALLSRPGHAAQISTRQKERVGAQYSLARCHRTGARADARASGVRVSA